MTIKICSRAFALGALGLGAPLAQASFYRVATCNVTSCHDHEGVRMGFCGLGEQAAATGIGATLKENAKSDSIFELSCFTGVEHMADEE